MTRGGVLGHKLFILGRVGHSLFDPPACIGCWAAPSNTGGRRGWLGAPSLLAAARYAPRSLNHGVGLGRAIRQRSGDRTSIEEKKRRR